MKKSLMKGGFYCDLLCISQCLPLRQGDKGSAVSDHQTGCGRRASGDEISVAPGIYRESVSPVRGGTDDAHRITYRSEVPLGAVITGAEPVKNWTLYEGNVWMARIPNGIFGSYNPYTTVILPGRLPQ